jgi:hypothetical protein
MAADSSGFLHPWRARGRLRAGKQVVEGSEVTPVAPFVELVGFGNRTDLLGFPSSVALLEPLCVRPPVPDHPRGDDQVAFPSRPLQWPASGGREAPRDCIHQ